MKCLRCNGEMVEDLNLSVTDGYGIDVREKGIFKKGISKVKCAVCPNCGYVELYVENLEKFKNLSDK